MLSQIISGKDVLSATRGKVSIPLLSAVGAEVDDAELKARTPRRTAPAIVTETLSLQRSHADLPLGAQGLVDVGSDGASIALRDLGSEDGGSARDAAKKAIAVLGDRPAAAAPAAPAPQREKEARSITPPLSFGPMPHLTVLWIFLLIAFSGPLSAWAARTAARPQAAPAAPFSPLLPGKRLLSTVAQSLIAEQKATLDETVQLLSDVAPDLAEARRALTPAFPLPVWRPKCIAPDGSAASQNIDGSK